MNRNNKKQEEKYENMIEKIADYDKNIQEKIITLKKEKDALGNLSIKELITNFKHLESNKCLKLQNPKFLEHNKNLLAIKEEQIMAKLNLKKKKLLKIKKRKLLAKKWNLEYENGWSIK